MAAELATRTCDKCGRSDTDPHHVQYVAFSHPVNGSGVDLSVSKHVQCCADDGCPICSTDLRQAQEAGADTEHLRKFLQDRPKELRQTLFEQFGVESPDFEIPTTATEEKT